MAKFRVLRDMTYAGRAFERNDVVSDAFVIENGSYDKLGVLLRTRYIEDVRDYGSMRKDELVAYARRIMRLKGVSHDMTKQEIVQLIDETLRDGDEKQSAAGKAKRQAEAEAATPRVSEAAPA